MWGMPQLRLVMAIEAYINAAGVLNKQAPPWRLHRWSPTNSNDSGVLCGIGAPDRRIPCVGEISASGDLELIFLLSVLACLKGSTVLRLCLGLFKIFYNPRRYKNCRYIFSIQPRVRRLLCPSNLTSILKDLTVLQFRPSQEVWENTCGLGNSMWITPSTAVQFHKEQIHAAPTGQPDCRNCEGSSQVTAQQWCPPEPWEDFRERSCQQQQPEAAFKHKFLSVEITILERQGNSKEAKKKKKTGQLRGREKSVFRDTRPAEQCYLL